MTEQQGLFNYYQKYMYTYILSFFCETERLLEMSGINVVGVNRKHSTLRMTGQHPVEDQCRVFTES